MSEDKYQSSAELSAEIRADLKAAFPKCKISVTKESYSGGRSVTVALMAASCEMFRPNVPGYHTSGYYQVNGYYINDSPILTPEAKTLLGEMQKIANKRNWDRSDAMVDHFDVNFYLHLTVGKWNKPFVKL